MFKNFRDKLKNAFNRFAKEVDETADVAEGEQETEQDKTELANEQSELEQEQKEKDAKEAETKAAEEEETLEEKKKQGFLGKLFKKKDAEEVQEDAKAPSVDEVEELDEAEIKEQEFEMPEDVPEDMSKTELADFQNKISRSVKELTDKGKEIIGRKEKEDEVQAAKEESEQEESQEKKKPGFIQKFTDSLTKKVLSESDFNDLFWELEVTLLENNVAVEVIDLMKENLKKELVDKPIPRKDIAQRIEKTLKATIEEILDLEKQNMLAEIPDKKPYKILIVGVNGSGKTTTIAKLVKLLQDNKFTTVLAASDTFRAAAIDQLQEHADALKVKLIRHDYNSDPAAVAFDAIKYAEAKKLDTVIIDTAGRLHSNANLMDELKKVYRVSKPDMTIFVGESITGNDCVEQAKEFQKVVDFDAIILSKADVDEKGGAAISVSYITQKPILYLGVGQRYEDLEEFDKYKIMYRIFGD
ncbi:MAG: signal recognition particle-docking protein FtsY [Nanoarchaeota archaeon]